MSFINYNLYLFNRINNDKYGIFLAVFNRSGVARAVLQTPL